MLLFTPLPLGIPPPFLGLRSGSSYFRVLSWAPIILNAGNLTFVQNFLNSSSTIQSFNVTPANQALLRENLALGITGRNATGGLFPIPASVLSTRAIFPIVRVYLYRQLVI